MPFEQFGVLEQETLFFRVIEERVWRKVKTQRLTASEQYTLGTDKQWVNAQRLDDEAETDFLHPETLVRPLSYEEKLERHIQRAIRNQRGP